MKKSAIEIAPPPSIARVAIKSANPRLQRDDWMLGTYIIDDRWVLCGLHPAVELCAHNFDSGSSLAAPEMPSKG